MTRWVFFTTGSGVLKKSHVVPLLGRLEGRVVTPNPDDTGDRRVAILIFVQEVEGRDAQLLYLTPAGPLGAAAVKADSLLASIRTFLANPNPSTLILDLDPLIAAL